MTDTDLAASNKELVRTFHTRLWAEADLGVIEEVFAPEAVAHWGDADSNAVEAVRADAKRYLAAFTEVSSSIDDLIGDGDRVGLRWTTKGTHSAAYGKVAPTGRKITTRGMDVFRLDGGRIVEAWSLWDALGLYQQLGLVDRAVGP
jgi:predicted ester cyclase